MGSVLKSSWLVQFDSWETGDSVEVSEMQEDREMSLNLIIDTKIILLHF